MGYSTPTPGDLTVPPATKDSPTGEALVTDLVAVDLLRKLVNELRLNNLYLEGLTGALLTTEDIPQE